jgi:hypothetical protein
MSMEKPISELRQSAVSREIPVQKVQSEGKCQVRKVQSEGNCQVRKVQSEGKCQLRKVQSSVGNF